MIKKFLKPIYHYYLISKSGLFDRKYYLETYPDVRKADVDPLWHFIRLGWKEGRNPSRDFDISGYIKCNSDVRLLEVNPLIHYIKHGKNESRSLKYSEKVKSIHESINQPTISIIIPVYNTLSYVKNCIQHLYKSTQNKSDSIEVIIVDNNSDKETKSWLKKAEENYRNLKVFSQEKNLGFGPAVNIGITQSVGEFIVILNSDTIPSPYWLENLEKAFQIDKHLGIVSAVTNYVGEGNQIDLDAIDLPISKIDKYADKIQNRNEIIYEPSRLVFFCVMIKGSVIDRIGTLDEGYFRGNFEDDDYCVRARMAGFKLGIVKNSFVYHHGSATYKENKFDYSELFDKNRKRFYRKAARISASNTLTSSRRIDQSSNSVISVIVRTVNRPDLLTNALNSLVNQTISDAFEVVLVNDGGPDLGQFLKNYEKRLNIKYVRNQISHGRTKALNEGISASIGKWISFLDDDDIYYPWHLESMYNATMTQTQYKFFYGSFNRTLISLEHNKTPIEILSIAPFEFSKKELMIGNKIPINTWLVNSEIFKNLGSFDPTFDVLEDYEFLLRLNSEYNFKLVKKVVAEYRVYLSELNSIVINRASFPEALEKIYDKYPSTNSYITTQRNQTLELQKKQIVKLHELKESLLQTSDPDNIISIYIEILSTIGAL